VNAPVIQKGDRIVWYGRHGIVKEIDTSAQKTARGRANGWPYAAWILFDNARSPDAWTCVNAFECEREVSGA
jgi:hypothetical protein